MPNSFFVPKKYSRRNDTSQPLHNPINILDLTNEKIKNIDWKRQPLLNLEQLTVDEVQHLQTLDLNDLLIDQLVELLKNATPQQQEKESIKKLLKFPPIAEALADSAKGHLKERKHPSAKRPEQNINNVLVQRSFSKILPDTQPDAPGGVPQEPHSQKILLSQDGLLATDHSKQLKEVIDRKTKELKSEAAAYLKNAGLDLHDVSDQKRLDDALEQAMKLFQNRRKPGLDGTPGSPQNDTPLGDLNVQDLNPLPSAPAPDPSSPGPNSSQLPIFAMDNGFNFILIAMELMFGDGTFPGFYNENMKQLSQDEDKSQIELQNIQNLTNALDDVQSSTDEPGYYGQHIQTFTSLTYGPNSKLMTVLKTETTASYLADVGVTLRPDGGTAAQQANAQNINNQLQVENQKENQDQSTMNQDQQTANSNLDVAKQMIQYAVQIDKTAGPQAL